MVTLNQSNKMLLIKCHDKKSCKPTRTLMKAVNASLKLKLKIKEIMNNQPYSFCRNIHTEEP